MLFLNIPKEIKIKTGQQWIEIQGPLGKILKKKPEWLKLHFKENKLYFLVSLNEQNVAKEIQFYSSLILKAIWGLSKGYSKKLLLVGIGYRVNILKDENILDLKLGLSHNVHYNITKDIEIEISTKENSITVKGPNKQRVNQIAAEIRNIKRPEVYKGKGIRYFNENIQLKEGKKSNL